LLPPPVFARAWVPPFLPAMRLTAFPLPDPLPFQSPPCFFFPSQKRVSFERSALSPVFFLPPPHCSDSSPPRTPFIHFVCLGILAVFVCPPPNIWSLPDRPFLFLGTATLVLPQVVCGTFQIFPVYLQTFGWFFFPCLNVPFGTASVEAVYVGDDMQTSPALVKSEKTFFPAFFSGELGPEAPSPIFQLMFVWVLSGPPHRVSRPLLAKRTNLMIFSPWVRNVLPHLTPPPVAAPSQRPFFVPVFFSNFWGVNFLRPHRFRCPCPWKKPPQIWQISRLRQCQEGRF